MTCSIEGCDRKAGSRSGMCLKHVNREWKRKNKDKVREYERKARAKNPDKFRAKWNRKYERMSADKKEAHKQRLLNWLSTLPPDVRKRLKNTNTRKREHKIIQATPKWADLKKIRQIYYNRPQGCHVDHIVPLKGKGVCGLHVPWNLQYLPAVENLKKGNKC